MQGGTTTSHHHVVYFYCGAVDLPKPASASFVFAALMRPKKAEAAFHGCLIPAWMIWLYAFSPTVSFVPSLRTESLG